MSERTVPCTYFDQSGPQNTDRTLQLARQRADELGIRHVVVASTSGETGLLAARLFAGQDREIIVVSHSAGFAERNTQELTEANRQAILEAGARIVTTQHALGGVNRAVRRKFGTYQLDEIIAFVLRTFSQGLKVACEITMMATDAGLTPAGSPVLAIGGTGHGADTAAVILAANAQDLFDLRVLELICKPSRYPTQEEGVE